MIRLLLSLCLLATMLPAQDAEKSVAEWLDYLKPKVEDGAWKEVPWRSEFGTAAVEAQRAKKPLLIWAMNGHPLGCT
ncbi:MAG: hypothetical protein KDB53_04860 [Planctomycetes bacterium]|nr:hypothetical protein [Planctomycetota bacterium]